MNILEVAMYVDSRVDLDPSSFADQYIFRPKRKYQEEIFMPLLSGDCSKVFNDYENSQKLVWDKYHSTIMEIPKVTQETELRYLYTFVSQNEYCLKQLKDIPSARTVGLTLFYNHVKDSALSYYASELKFHFEEMKKLRDMSKEKLSNHLAISYKEKIKTLNYFIDNPKLFDSELESLRLNLLAQLKKKYPPKYFLKHTKFIKRYESQGLTPELQQAIDSFTPDYGDFAKQFSRVYGPEEFFDYKEKNLKNLREHHKSLVASVELDIQETQTRLENYPLTVQELKGMSRKDLKAFIQSLKAEDLSSLSTTSEALFKVLNQTIVELDEKVVPFMWHDSQISPPHPLDLDYSSNNLTIKRKLVKSKNKLLRNGIFEEITDTAAIIKAPRRDH